MTTVGYTRKYSEGWETALGEAAERAKIEAAEKERQAKFEAAMVQFEADCPGSEILLLRKNLLLIIRRSKEILDTLSNHPSLTLKGVMIKIAHRAMEILSAACDLTYSSSVSRGINRTNPKDAIETAAADTSSELKQLFVKEDVPNRPGGRGIARPAISSKAGGVSMGRDGNRSYH